MQKPSKAKLLELAKEARFQAHAPYSGFKVGAALSTSSGQVFTGANVENASYGLTVCAERTAVLKAVSEGETNFCDLVVVTDADQPVLPCGACLQVLAEFCGHLPILTVNLKGKKLEQDLSELLPQPFKFSGGGNGS